MTLSTRDDRGSSPLYLTTAAHEQMRCDFFPNSRIAFYMKLTLSWASESKDKKKKSRETRGNDERLGHTPQKRTKGTNDVFLGKGRRGEVILQGGRAQAHVP